MNVHANNVGRLPTMSNVPDKPVLAPAPVPAVTTGRTTAKASYASLFQTVRKECKNHHDFVRELISNSYDANATKIAIFPLYLTSASAQPIGSIFAICDDGVGMDYFPRTVQENEGLTTPPQSSIDAYTQLGFSTNNGDVSIGRFCYGSKQAQNKADAGFILVTRTTRMPPGYVLLIDVDDIEYELLHRGGITWHVVQATVAVEAITRRLSRQNKPTELANTIDKLSAHVQSMSHGTVQIIISRASQFHERKLCNLNTLQRTWKVPSKTSRIFKDDIEFSTLYTIIRFFTRHGNAFHDSHNQFWNMKAKMKNHFGGELGLKLTHEAEVRLFTKDHLEGYVIPYGYPRPEEYKNPGNPDSIKGKSQIAWTGCWARLGPGMFTDDVGRSFAVIWDQNCFYTLRTDFESLSRRGWKRTDCDALGQVSSGFRIQACGVPVCELPIAVIKTLPILPHSQLTFEERKALIAFTYAGEKGGAVCKIEGNFSVEPNRASLSQEEIAGLKTNTAFARGLANVLHSFITTKNPHGLMMAHLLKCHRETQRSLDEADSELEAQSRRESVNSSSRLFFRQTGSTPAWMRPLCMTFFIPADTKSHENQLQHIVSTLHTYALYAATLAAPGNTPTCTHTRALTIWKYLRPAVHFSKGVDVVGVFRDHEQSARDPLVLGHHVVEPTYNIEYKWSLLTDYNHPLANTDFIVAWDIDHIEVDNTVIQDKQECDGVVERDAELDGFGYQLAKIRDHSNGHLASRTDASKLHTVRIICLKHLIQHTFGAFCDIEFNVAQEGRVTKKNRHR